MRELEAAAFGGLRRVDHQMAHRRVEIAQALRLGINDRDAERIAQPPFDRLDRGRGVFAAQLPRQRFGGAVDAVDIIARIVKPVAHLLPRQAAALGRAAGQRLVDDLEALPGAAIGGVERDELVGELRLLQRGALELFGGQGGAANSGSAAASRSAPARRSPASAATSSHSSGNSFCSAVEEGGGQRAVVMLDLAEIGGRDAERGGEVGLFDAAVLAQGFEAGACEDAVAGQGYPPPPCEGRARRSVAERHVGSALRFRRSRLATACMVPLRGG